MIQENGKVDFRVNREVEAPPETYEIAPPETYEITPPKTYEIK